MSVPPKPQPTFATGGIVPGPFTVPSADYVFSCSPDWAVITILSDAVYWDARADSDTLRAVLKPAARRKRRTPSE